MRVVVQANKNRPDQRIVFIKGDTVRWGEFSIPAYFPKDLQKQPDAGSTIEVMICGMLWNRNEFDHFDFNSAPRCFFIKEPTTEIKVRFDGFECEGSMCTTTSFATNLSTNKKIDFITPGRLESILHVADNVNIRNARNPLTPGIGWIAKNPNNFRWRLEGVEGLEELDIHRKRWE